MQVNMKKIILVSISSIIIMALSGCAQSTSNLSGTYNADTFRAKYDPKPGVDYTEVLAKSKARKKSALNLPSGTYEAKTFRAKYDPDPNVDYGKGKGVAIETHHSDSDAFFSILGGLALGVAMSSVNSPQVITVGSSTIIIPATYTPIIY